MTPAHEGRTQATAVAVTLAFIGLMALYVREFRVFSNTIGVKSLVVGAIVAALALAGGFLYFFRTRFQPWQRHQTEITLLFFLSAFFAPLLASLLNRGLSRSAEQSFEFIAERPYVASGYGILKGETLKPSGYYLDVRQNGQLYRFSYKSQAFFPLTRPGELILLPLQKGLFGCRVISLK